MECNSMNESTKEPIENSNNLTFSISKKAFNG